MEREKFKKVVLELKERLELEIGTNPLTKEEGIKINGLAGEYDILFIRENRDEIIKTLKKLNSEKIKINIEISKSDYEKLSKISENLNITVEELIIRKISKF
ncbi:hypothetical protein [Peptoniphilus stercorisuis]|uniref:Isocitrate/isopropylmalate dehydrogenase n=1 Tax=Peptoniphilus stercorisuis TaxID=1436965 RepID=A0ABS4KCM1_9FIRM|nr:hypothetical protein [Peptoniphilus stercorisuis]MBP2025539.1 isocitrate/isopropylmalate dehydrogenase [Peptoniphilus stercorisuis]